MPIFSSTITDFWRTSFLGSETLHADAAFTLAINPALEENSRIMLLTVDNSVKAVLTPALATRLALRPGEDLSEKVFRQRLAAASVTLNGADYLFYFPEAEKALLQQENLKDATRRLTEADAEAFAGFEAAAPEGDIDGAGVGLDHWVAFGAFEQKHLVAAASAYPWDNAMIADIGVLTLPAFRGKGHALRLVRAISHYACRQGYEPQYRCQLDNHASVALAKASGLALYGTWDVVAPDSAM